MTPRFSKQNAVNGAHFNFETWRDFVSGDSSFIQSMYRVHVLFCKDSSRCSGAFYVPAFFDRIAHVISLSPKEQVLRVYASWIVAPWTVVQRLKAFWYRPVSKCPRKAMGHAVKLTSLDDAIPIVVYTATPQPAGIGLIDFGPKICLAFSEMLGSFSDDTASKRAAPKLRCVRRKTLEFDVAYRTLKQHLKTFLLDVKEAAGSSWQLPSTLASSPFLSKPL